MKSKLNKNSEARIRRLKNKINLHEAEMKIIRKNLLKITFDLWFCP